MHRKKIIIVCAVFVFVAAGASLYALYRAQLSGSSPAFRSPVKDITTLIPPSGEAPRKAENATAIPLQLQDGFAISVFAKGLKDPRALGLDPSGRLVVSVPSQGKLFAFDTLSGTASPAMTIVAGLTKPHGFAFDCGSPTCKLYVAEPNSVRAYDYDRTTAKTSNGKKLLDLPGSGNHTTRTIKLQTTGTQKRLLISIGSSCNVCTEADPHRAAVWQADLPDGTNFRSYATGLRNSVFMSTRPGTNELWATEMGRDLLGDDTPPDEINILTEGKNYGWPLCYGHNIHDTNFDRNQYIQDPCANSVPAHIDIPAHSAPLGLTFLGQSWPKEFQGDLLVALHGSWNRSVPSGYKIVRYKLSADGSVLSSSDFLTGFLPAKSKTALGRPVDILDASTQDTRVLYVSDDKAGVIYQIKYQNK